MDRDSVDSSAVKQTRSGIAGDTPNMGSRIYSQKDMGGWPNLAVNIRMLQVPENPHAVAPGQKFRTNIEMWLEKYASDLEPARGGKATLAKQSASSVASPAVAQSNAATNATLAATPTKVTIREAVTVSFKGISHQTANDWIGLFEAGAENSACVAWRYANNGTLLPGNSALSQGSCTFLMPARPGAYEFRYFPNNSYASLAISNQVTVPEPVFNIALTVSSDTVSPGQAVTMTYSDVPDLDGGEWIGLYKTGADNNSWEGWQWTNGKAKGSTTFTMPAEPGVYEFRIIAGGIALATSKPITVK